MPSTMAAAPVAAVFRPAPQRQRRLATRPAMASAEGALAPQTIQLTLRKPLGMVLAERKTPAGAPQVWVEELVPGGNAEKSGKVQVGDVLSRCSATVLKSGKEGEFEAEDYGKRPYDNWETVSFDCTGKQFDTVMAALGSNSERWGIFTIQLELLREAAAAAPAAAQGPEQ